MRLWKKLMRSPSHSYEKKHHVSWLNQENPRTINYQGVTLNVVKEAELSFHRISDGGKLALHSGSFHCHKDQTHRKSTAFCTIQQSLQVLLTPFDVRTDDDVNWNLRLTAPMMQRCQSLQMAMWQKTVVDAIHFELGVSINVQNLHGPQAVRCHPWPSPMNVQCPGIASCGLRSPFQVSLWVQGKTCKTLVP